MQNPRLASRYAKSLLDLAIEQNSVEPTLKDMRMLHELCSVSHDFEVMLKSPVIKGDKKLHVINAVVKGQGMSQLTQAFINLLVSKGRELNLPEISAAFIEQYNKLKNIRTVSLTTALPVSDSVRKGIVAKVASFMPSDSINLQTKTDESLIGGFVLEVEDQLFDASIKKSLNDIKAKLLDHTYETKM
jgi:F-type H+-transporting ATPase subunit delta